ncbi:amidohydrolase family protein [Haladaptatus caseinilyticus]|uniref:amidohydrolase family protein n=1 Tax=Haladaptatus caseinilyticus TaxID=2993314 RepID=UPI00224AB99F|nr:amidohydrolase family protein [Haladaptatus caseinilyticus]
MHCIRTAGIYHPDREQLDETVVVVEDGLVVELRSDIPVDAEVIVDTDGYAMPGFVDAHSHASIRPWEGDQLNQLRAPPAVGAIRSTSNLRCDLEAGTTTMRLMGEERGLDLQLAELERQGELDAPRLLPSGVHLTPTGGHGKALTATDGVEAIRRRIRENIDEGAHHVKYFATGGVSSETGDVGRPLYTNEEVMAIVDEAHRLGVHVAAHAHGGQGALSAAEAGVDTIEHGGVLDHNTLDALDGGDQHVVGTFSILYHPHGIEAGDADSSAVMAKVEEARERGREAWEDVLSRDVPIALGTDSMHGHLADEISHLLDLGASPATALRAITTEASRAAHIDDRVGTLEVGKSADLVVVDDPPLENPQTVAEPRVVVKRGEVVA